MITAQIRKCRRLIAQAREVVISRDYEQAGKPSCDWDDSQSRSGLINGLVTDGLAVLEAVKTVDLDTEQADAVGLLGVVVGQDVEPDPEREGKWRITRGVAPDRTISVVDPQARHGRKTPSQRRDGYKAHIGAEPETGIITACDITAANVPDGPVGGGTARRRASRFPDHCRFGLRVGRNPNQARRGRASDHYQTPTSDIQLSAGRRSVHQRRFHYRLPKPVGDLPGR